MTIPVYQKHGAMAADKRRESARELLGYHLAGIRRWIQAHRRSDGHPFWIIPASDPTELHAYYTDLYDCTCPARTTWRRGEPCKHILAVRLWLEAYRAGEIVLGHDRCDILAEAERIAQAAYERAWAPRAWGSGVWSAASQQPPQEA